MSKKTMCASAVSCIEKHGYLLLICILVISLFVALRAGFGRIDLTVTSETDVARLIATIAFPMSGIMLFVLGQSLVLREKYDDVECPISRIVTAYTHMSVISAITLVLSAITGLLSFQYLKSAGDVLLSVSIYFFLSVFILLIVNTTFFTIYTINVKKTIQTIEETCND